jgi:hypothetical protein
MKLFINNVDNNIINDFFWDKYFPNNYCLKNPICFQIFTNTLNSKENQKKSIINNIFQNMLIYISQKDPVRTFIFFYIFAKTWWIILIVLVIYILSKKKFIYKIVM